MIKILLESGGNGELQSFSAAGHAGAAERGFDIVCSAVTVLLRTALLTLQVAEKQRKGLKLKVQAEKRGFLSAKITDFSEYDKPMLMYLFDFLAIGLTSIKEEYPDCVDIQINGSSKT